MHKRLKLIIKNTKEIFSVDFLESIARETEFIQRKGKITAENFLSFNTFSSNDLCEASLTTLVTRLNSQFDISISQQGLNDRFNECSVNFMKRIFNNIVLNQNKVLSRTNKNTNFNRILINDSTSYGLPTKFYDQFKGSGGNRSKAAIKIQLQYDLLSGSFLAVDINDGTSSDNKYVDIMDKYTNPGDLRLSDLGYYNYKYLKSIDDKKAFFISKLKSSTAVYIKNPSPSVTAKGKVLKSTEYIKIDIFELIQPLSDGETIQLKNIYIGSKKELKSTLIITKLSEENKLKRENKHLASVNRGRGTINTKSLLWNEINVYITNISDEVLSAEEIHEIYTLRWQVEIMFKIWKSIFNINNVKPVKLERFLCFLYGRLIALLISSMLVFTAKDIIYDETSKCISEIKAFSQVTEFFNKLRTDIFKGEIVLLNLFETIVNVIKLYGIKSKKKDKKTSNEILKSLSISKGNIKSVAS